jgi:lysophospholipase L1-like esterase
MARKRRLVAIVLSTVAGVAAACAQYSSSASSALISVIAQPQTATVAPGKKVSFSAVVQGASSNQSAAVIWSVQEPGGGSVDLAGVYTAPPTPGTFHVVATSFADPSSSDVATVTVESASVLAVAVTPKSASTLTRGTVPFSAVVSGASAGQSTAVTWSVQETGGGAVDATGLYAAPATTGTYHVIATSVADGTKTDAATVQVTATPVIAVSVSPKTAATTTGRTLNFTATVTGASAGQSTAVTWSLQETAGGAVDTAGHYTAPSSAGTFHVIATSVADTTKKDTATVTVTSIAVAVTPKTAALTTAGTRTFSAAVTGTVTGQSTAVTWSVQEAGGGTVDTVGRYTAPAVTGTFHVVATSVADTSKSDVATVTVSAPVVAVTISPKTTSAALGGSVKFSATVTGTSNTAVTWSVQEGASGGSIDSAGNYMAPATGGSWHVVVTAAADTSKTDVATVVVVTSVASAAPMTLISRSVPATSSAGTASWGQDASYGGLEWGFHMTEFGSTGTLTYDLSGVASGQRQNLLVALYMTKGDPYYQLNYRAATYTPEFTPSAYVLEGATSVSGPWTSLVTVTTNNNPFKSHSIANFGGFTFLRFRATSAPYGCRVKMDVYDASSGITDGIVFYGDSITANIFQSGYSGFPPQWFSKYVQSQHGAFFPFVGGGGYPFMTSGDAVDLIVNASGTNFSSGLSTPLKTVFSAAKYAALIYGANDAPAQDLVDAFRSNYRQIIDALRAQGQTVVLAAPSWATDSSRQAGLVQIRAAIGFHLSAWVAKTYAGGDYVWNGGRAYRCTTGGSSVSGPAGTGTGIADGGTARWSYVPSLREDYAANAGVIPGPDLYTVFLNHPEWLSDGLHPNATGEQQWRDAWANWASAAIYGP